MIGQKSEMINWWLQNDTEVYFLDVGMWDVNVLQPFSNATINVMDIQKTKTKTKNVIRTD